MTEPWLWWKDGIIYQIYPRSFADSNSDGIGDLQGITSRLDYLKQLGIHAIWLSPIYPSPDIDFGYDVSDYEAVDPKFGSLEDYDQLVEAAHQRGIRVIMDLVLNHTSDQHPWFQASRQSIDNPYRDWYLWRPGKNGGVPNNWQSVFGGSGWQLDPQTGEYYFHMFYPEQPDLNWRNPQVQDAILNSVRFWLEHGTDGFRLDVFNAYFKEEALPDNPIRLGLRGFDRLEHIYDMDQPEMLPFLARLRELVDEYPERYMVGETFLATPEKAASYCGEDRLHAAFNFEFTEQRWDPKAFAGAIAHWETALGSELWPNYVLGNHDIPRIKTRLLRYRSREQLKIAAALLLTLRGTPYIYYGEEIGMENIHLKREEILDPVSKRYWPLYMGRDSCRSPMQWSGSAGAGFSSARPWLPIHPNYPEINVAAEETQSDSLLHWYRKLIQLRGQSETLRRGSYRLLYANGSVLSYIRDLGDDHSLVILNFSSHKVRLDLGDLLPRTHWQLLISNRRATASEIKINPCELLPDEALILKSG